MDGIPNSMHQSINAAYERRSMNADTSIKLKPDDANRSWTGDARWQGISSHDVDIVPYKHWYSAVKHIRNSD